MRITRWKGDRRWNHHWWSVEWRRRIRHVHLRPQRSADRKREQRFNRGGEPAVGPSRTGRTRPWRSVVMQLDLALLKWRIGLRRGVNRAPFAAAGTVGQFGITGAVLSDDQLSGM